LNLNNYFCSARNALRALILACACFVAAAAVVAHAEPLPLVSDLQAVAKIAREQSAPVFVAFTLKRCPYCYTARREYWAPMNGSTQWQGKVVMVELELDGAPALRDFDGNATTARDFARRFGIRSVPTVIVFDTGGTPATSPLVGLTSGDFYGLYLEQAIDAGIAKMRTARE
jgi:thioredoxin-related protein